MGLFDWFRRNRDRPLSELDGFLQKIDRQTIPAVAREVKDPTYRVAMAVSLLVLEQSGRFARDLMAALGSAPVSPLAPHPSRFDAVVFETAAFSGYYLLADYLGSPESESDEDFDADIDEDPFLFAARNAHNLTGSMLKGRLSFDVNEEVFSNRPISYSLRAGRQGGAQMFEGVLTEAVENGRPATMKNAGISLSLVPVIVSLHAKSFVGTTVPALADVTRNIVDRADELGLSPD